MPHADTVGQPGGPLPWDRYNRIRLRPGTAYPVGQGEVEMGLTAAGIRVGGLIMFRRDVLPGHRQEEPDSLPLLSAEWNGSSTQLWIFAVPSEHRALAHGVMVREALPAACRWFVSVPSRGNAWSAIRHSFAIFLVGVSLTIEEA